MLECLVFGHRAAEKLTSELVSPADITIKLPEPSSEDKKEYPESFFEEKRAELRKTMTLYANAVRTPKGMAMGKSFVDSLISELDEIKLTDRAGYELYSMASAAKYILDGAIARTESVGAHYIEPDSE